MFMSVPGHRHHARPLRREPSPPQEPFVPSLTDQETTPETPAVETTEFVPEDGANVVNLNLTSPDDISGFVTLLDATLEGEQDG